MVRMWQMVALGTGYAQAKMLIKVCCRRCIKDRIDNEEVETYSKYFISELIANGKRWYQLLKIRYSFFAAGNDGTNNDDYPTSPANIRAPNSITVAASVGYES